MDDSKPISMEEARTQALTVMSEKLAGPNWLIERAQNTIAQILQLHGAQYNISGPKEIAFNLLVRLWNELAAVALLCQHGYSLQAFAPASVIYEAGWMLAAIGNDEEAAKRWFEHDIESASYEKVLKMTEAGLRNLAGDEGVKQKDRQYGWYRELCMAKHVNPKVQKYEGFEVDAKTRTTTFSYGPEVTNEAIKKAWWVMPCAVRFTYPALYTFANNHLGESEKKKALELITALENEQDKLENEIHEELKAAGML